MTAQPFVDTSHGRVSFAETDPGTLLVILHSLLTDRRAFDGVIPSLPGRVITLDLPGYGLSDRAAPSIEAFADQMAAAVAELCDEPATVIRTGLGSFVALGLTIRHPELVARLVLVGAGATFSEHARPAFANMARLVEDNDMAAVTPPALRRIFSGEFLETHPEEAAERIRVLETADPEVLPGIAHAPQLQDLDGFIKSIASFLEGE